MRLILGAFGGLQQACTDKRSWFYCRIVLKNGWAFNYDLGYYGTNYTLRAGTARAGLGANLPEDAFYPATYIDSNGTTLTGAHTYVMHFGKNGTPPINAFWSITM